MKQLIIDRIRNCNSTGLVDRWWFKEYNISFTSNLGGGYIDEYIMDYILVLCDDIDVISYIIKHFKPKISYNVLKHYIDGRDIRIDGSEIKFERDISIDVKKIKLLKLLIDSGYIDDENISLMNYISNYNQFKHDIIELINVIIDRFDTYKMDIDTVLSIFEIIYKVDRDRAFQLIENIDLFHISDKLQEFYIKLLTYDIEERDRVVDIILKHISLVHRFELSTKNHYTYFNVYLNFFNRYKIYSKLDMIDFEDSLYLLSEGIKRGDNSDYIRHHINRLDSEYIFTMVNRENQFGDIEYILRYIDNRNRLKFYRDFFIDNRNYYRYDFFKNMGEDNFYILLKDFISVCDNIDDIKFFIYNVPKPKNLSNIDFYDIIQPFIKKEESNFVMDIDDKRYVYDNPGSFILYTISNHFKNRYDNNLFILRMGGEDRVIKLINRFNIYTNPNIYYSRYIYKNIELLSIKYFDKIIEFPFISDNIILKQIYDRIKPIRQYKKNIIDRYVIDYFSIFHIDKSSLENYWIKLIDKFERSYKKIEYEKYNIDSIKDLKNSEKFKLIKLYKSLIDRDFIVLPRVIIEDKEEASLSMRKLIIDKSYKLV